MLATTGARFIAPRKYVVPEKRSLFSACVVASDGVSLIESCQDYNFAYNAQTPLLTPDRLAQIAV